jgi:hypothetical protein
VKVEDDRDRANLKKQRNILKKLKTKVVDDMTGSNKVYMDKLHKELHNKR